MKHLLEVCLIVALAASVTPSLAAQSNPAIPVLRKGISVQMPVARTAVSMPDADQEDALVVTITDDGNVFVRLDPTDPDAVAGGITEAMSNRAEKKVYIKADAGVPYAQVVRVLAAVRSAGVQQPDLLTASINSLPSAVPVAPEGLEVVVLSPQASSRLEGIVVQLAIPEESLPVFKINGEIVSQANLQSRIAQLLQKSGEKIVQIEAKGRLTYADVVNLADVCGSTGARVALIIAP